MTETLLQELDHVLRSEDARKALRQTLVSAQLLRVDDDLGGGPTPIAARLETVSPGREATVLEAVSQGRVTLSRIYEDRRRRADLVLWTSLALAGAFAAAVLGGIVLSFAGRMQVNALSALVPLGPGALSGGTFWLYTRERTDLKIIEADLADLETFERRMQVAVALEDKTARKAALDAILKLMSRHN